MSSNARSAWVSAKAFSTALRTSGDIAGGGSVAAAAFLRAAVLRVLAAGFSAFAALRFGGAAGSGWGSGAAATSASAGSGAAAAIGPSLSSFFLAPAMV